MARIKTRSIYTLNYVITGHQATDIEEARYLSSFIEFDMDGNPIKEEQLDPEGHLIERYYRAFFPHGKIKSEKYETGEDGFVSAREFMYDEEGLLLEEKGTYAQGDIEHIIYSYDEQGNLISRRSIDDEGEEEFTEEIQYLDGKPLDEKRYEYGELVVHRSIVYSSSGWVESVNESNTSDGSKRSRFFSYFDDGKLSVEEEFVNKKILTRKAYTYDDQGRIESMREEEAFRRDVMHFQYDEAGNIVLQEEKDMDGNVLQQIIRTYDTDGQPLSTDVYLDGIRTGYSRRYALQFEYAYFPEEENAKG